MEGGVQGQCSRYRQNLLRGRVEVCLECYRGPKDHMRPTIGGIPKRMVCRIPMCIWSSWALEMQVRHLAFTREAEPTYSPRRSYCRGLNHYQ